MLNTVLLEGIQPREEEGCFSEVNEAGEINIYLIQDQIPEWLLAFLDNDLQISYLRLNQLPLLTLKFRHMLLTMPIYNQAPTSKQFTLCSLDYPDMRVNKIQRYTLSDKMFTTLRNDVTQLEDNDPSNIYERYDKITENGDDFTVLEQGMQDTLKADVG